MTVLAGGNLRIAYTRHLICALIELKNGKITTRLQKGRVLGPGEFKAGFYSYIVNLIR